MQLHPTHQAFVYLAMLRLKLIKIRKKKNPGGLQLPEHWQKI